MSATARRFKRRRPALYLGPQIPDDASPLLKERIARRRLVAVTGRCPCGATLELPADLRPGFRVVRVEHEDGCPAVDGDDGA